jgi:hypothetical protein
MSKMKSPWLAKAFLTAVILGLSATLANAADWIRVAYDDAGAPTNQPHLVESAGNWRCPNPGTDDEVLRSCAFGQSVTFGYAGLNPKAQYKAKLRWFSDGVRELRVKAGETVLLPSVKLEVGKTIEQEVTLPATTGILTLVVEHIAGSHAIISDIEILSTDVKPLTAIPPPAVELPRLSPRPAAVAGCATPSVDLGGTWKFITKAPEDLAAKQPADVAAWKDIQVPGEWVMQGFTVEHKPQGAFPCGTGDAAAYARSFSLPGDWKGKKVKLRCDSVYSDTVIYINGKEAGKHVGCFIPFELEVTALVKPGQDNFITMSVMNESLADKLANGSRYACHQLGGITRKIQLFAVPETHLSRLHVATRFDAEFKNATLELDTEVEGGEADLVVSLKRVKSDGSDRSDRSDVRAKPGKISIPVANPAKWDNEHPNLYTLTIKLEKGGKTLETISQKVGFRQVEVRGNQMFVNNVPVKLRGVCRHEVDPLTGRADTARLARQDAELFREGNCNYIRTSHYPPTEEFVEACDELGLFIECEAPFCWAQMTKLTTAQIAEFMTRQHLEMLEAYRNHPSITHWSMGNESATWNYFKPAAQQFKQLDPTRPINFSAWTPGEDGNFCDLGNNHYPGVCGGSYPGLQGPGKFANSPRPIVFDEYCHLNSYNRRELATDPGLRDLWGAGLNAMWENILKSQGCLGGAIWAGIDDTFFLPNGDTVGYGTWGPIDGWRRPKPEYWHMKKAYSPFHIAERAVPANQPVVKLAVENRCSFTDLSEVSFRWILGNRIGTAKTAGAPGKTGILEIPVQGDGQMLRLQAIGPRGFVEDKWEIALGTDPSTALPVPASQPGAVKLEKTADAFVVRGGNYAVTINAVTGQFSAPFSGPELMLLPRNGDSCGGIQMLGKEKEVTILSDACHGWKAETVTAETTADGVVVQIKGAYTEAAGSYTCRFGNDGTIAIAYDFTLTAKGKCDPRQTGIVFRLPQDCRTLSWRRNAHWSAYPLDHIGRDQGTAPAFMAGVPLSGLAGPRAKPTWHWSADANQYGSNDFRSTKMNVFEAALLSPAGKGLRILSDGTQHVRSWVDGNSVNLLVADYTNHGSPSFFNEHVIPYRPLTPGSVVKGTVRLEIR